MVKQPHESVKRGMGIQNTSEDLVNEGKIIVKKIKKKKKPKTHTHKKNPTGELLSQIWNMSQN